MAVAEHAPGAQTATEIDLEPNWETAVYSCPMSVKTAKGEYSLSMLSVFDVKANDWYKLAPEPQKHVYYCYLENDCGKWSLVSMCSGELAHGADFI